ncbi:SNF2 family N-terminal domain-containing protein [Mycena pura]|uniref:SNF2 family N-terminal domain-containing protein n=1 Tax=Mycena pura TaxID=153505 RepID=A0AAD6YBK8_9AGAR|nr:SNF2 family N-terminal domain-containing protein [Mycena pura]
MSRFPKDNRSTFDRIWDIHPTEDLELLATMNVRLYVVNEEASLKAGDEVQISPDTEHFMSRFDSMWEQETPALVVSSARVQCGVIDLYFGANLCPWLMMKETGVKVSATVCNNSGSAEVTLKLNICAPIGVKAMYLPRMRWVLSRSQLDEFSWDTPQGPPALWQVTLLRKYGLNTVVSATSSWMEEPSPLELYSSPGLAAEMTAYSGHVPIKTKLYHHQRQALLWALQQEDPPLPTSGSNVQFWRFLPKRVGLFQNTLHRKILGAADLKAGLGRGGLLADDMGLGKTLTIVALIALTKDTPIDGYSQTTLIVAPLSVLDTWKNEIEKHCPSLTYHVYHPGGQKVGPKVDLLRSTSSSPTMRASAILKNVCPSPSGVGLSLTKRTIYATTKPRLTKQFLRCMPIPGGL